MKKLPFLILCFGILPCVETQAQQPNLLFVFTDQQSYDMVGYHEGSQAITPHIDQIAREGVAFNHCVSNSPLCTPHRGMLMTGQHPLYNGCFTNDVPLLPNKGTTFAQALNAAGYNTAYVGKWHLYGGGSRDTGIPPGENIPERQYNYDVSVLNPALIEPYKDMDIKLRADLKDDPSMFACRKEQYRNYLAMVTACDEAFGRLVQILKDKGFYHNTLIVFTSDHGDLIGSHHARLPKLSPQDYSCRVPLVISGKYAIRRSRRSDLLIGTMDIMPTVLGFLGIDIPGSVQGLDLSEAILKGNDDAVQIQPLFMYAARHYRGVYTKDWTYTFAVDKASTGASMHTHESFRGGSDIEVLYDRKNDPAQLHNYFGHKKHRRVQKELHKATLEWMDTYGDKGYGEADFMSVLSWEEWRKNYTYRPIDLLKKTNVIIK